MIRIANISGFYGDRPSAAREMVEGGPVDVLTGDWLAELTMLILARTRSSRSDGGYARSFVAQMSEVMGVVVERGIKVVSNAGGLDPHGCADAVREVANGLGLDPSIAVVTGDDLMERMPELLASGAEFEHLRTGEPLGERSRKLVTANAYLGCRGIVAALDAGADIVITGRVTDAALVLAPAVWHHGWDRTDWDRLAGGVAAGHVIECGTQATGGNYSFSEDLDDPLNLGFPFAEIHDDGSSVIGKHPGTGGEVSVGTVVSQLLYEIGGPRYLNPDVTSRFDTVQIEQLAGDRVRLSGTVGEPPPPGLKVIAAAAGGYRNSGMVGITGSDVEAKADLVTRQFWEACPWDPDDYLEARAEIIGRPRAGSNPAAVALLRISVKDPDEAKVGRKWSNTFAQIALGSIPGYFAMAPPAAASPFADVWPTTIARHHITHVVSIGDEVLEVPATVPPTDRPEPIPEPTLEPWKGGETVDVELGRVAGARSGDKAGDANVGVFVDTDRRFRWLAWFLTAERLVELLPDLGAHRVVRHVFANLRALNFEVLGLLDQGVSSALRVDPQAKGLGEYVRSAVVPVPVELLDG